MKNIFFIALALVFVLSTACRNNNDHYNESTLKQVGTENEFKRLLSMAIQRRNNTPAIFENSLAATSPNNNADLSIDYNDYSSTTLIEENVDESDLVKYDGNYLYTIQAAEYHYPDSRTGEKLRVLKTNQQDPTVELIQEIEFDDTDFYSYSRGIFLLPKTSDHQLQKLMLIRVRYGYDAIIQNTNTSAEWAYRGSTQILIYQQTSSGDLLEVDTINLTGYHEDSRIIDNRLIISHYGTPSLISSSQNTGSFEDLLNETHISDLVPHISFNDNPSSPAFAGENCYIPNTTDDNLNSNGLSYLASISLDNINDTKFICIFSNSGSLYASAYSAFVTNWNSDKTQIHYIDLRNGALAYRGSAQIQGSLGFNPQFRLSEYQGKLRTVSSWNWFDDESQMRIWQHQLNIFSLRNIPQGALRRISQLPNELRPDPIGKPGEGIFGIRFLQDKAFIVTFEQIDPFYVLDLKQATDPYIAGELEIPGFSTLLQPISDNLILGVGRDENQLKLEIFDFTDIKQPVSNDVYLLDQALYSTAEWDHHALTLLKMPDSNTVRLALPTISRNIIANDLIASNFHTHKLNLFNLQLTTGSISFQGEMPAISNNNSNYSWDIARSVIHTDNIYFTVGGRLWSANWDNPNELWMTDF